MSSILVPIIGLLLELAKKAGTELNDKNYVMLRLWYKDNKDRDMSPPAPAVEQANQQIDSTVMP
jgi:hypothetical protein